MHCYVKLKSKEIMLHNQMAGWRLGMPVNLMWWSAWMYVNLMKGRDTCEPYKGGKNCVRDKDEGHV